MGLHTNREIGESGRLGIWEITENEQALIEGIALNSTDIARFRTIGHEQIRLQWLAVRNLLSSLLSENESIQYTKNGNPYLQNSPYHISITHSGKFAGILLCESQKAGIDIQQITDKIGKIGGKFMSALEMIDIEPVDSMEKLHVYWGAKESLYKLWGDGSLDFKQNINIEPFVYKKSGNIVGGIVKKDVHNIYHLHYEWLDNFMLVYTLNN